LNAEPLRRSHGRLLIEQRRLISRPVQGGFLAHDDGRSQTRDLNVLPGTTESARGGVSPVSFARQALLLMR
jgi:hypothetical protein